MTTQNTAQTAETPSETWMSAWVGYHLCRMEAVETVEDIALLMRFGETCVRNTFEGINHNRMFKHILEQRAHRESRRGLAGGT